MMSPLHIQSLFFAEKPKIPAFFSRKMQKFRVFFQKTLDNTYYTYYIISMKDKDLLSLLQRNGWVVDRINGSHHILVKGNQTISLPVHGKDMKKGLESGTKVKKMRAKARKEHRFMNIVYPAICHFEDGGYWCEFPDLEGCFSQGDTELEIVGNAREALEGYVISLLERGCELPKASAITGLHAEDGGFTTYISCDISGSGKFVRKNVTLPEWLSVRAEKASINFSQTLQESLFKKLGISADVTA